MSDADTILTALRAVSGLHVYDGYVTDSDNDAKTISAPLPYVVFYSIRRSPTPGDSLAGTSGARLREFQISFVGSTREQAEWASEKSRTAIDRKFLTFTEGKRFVHLTDDSLDASRDDTWSRPDGGPLFHGADRYDVGI